MLVGDAAAYATLLQMARGDMPTPEHPEALDPPRPRRQRAPPRSGVGRHGRRAPRSARARTSTKGAICARHRRRAATTSATSRPRTKAGTGCGGCVPLVTDLLKHELAEAGVEVDNALCEHFAHSRQELFDLVRVHRLHVVRPSCSPATARAAAARSASRRWRRSSPRWPTATSSTASRPSLQDTNDHFLANLQKDGTYSVVPRIPGGEITPDELIAIGEVARDFGLYTKITGGQRIDLFGARVEQLPAIWERLIDAGFESGHAYGKALRTVKSCVGETWCRYGVQDSTAMAIRLELRYRGLRAPHKLKSAVSGCARECAEAQSKDFGVIATERGWNLYVGGNGGKRPRHAELFAEDLDDETLIRYIDRFLMFYVRTADRLERTATWLEKLEGGIDHLRAVVDRRRRSASAPSSRPTWQRHVDTYECEWKATIDDPAASQALRVLRQRPRRSPTRPSCSSRSAARSARPGPTSASSSPSARSPTDRSRRPSATEVEVQHPMTLLDEPTTAPAPTAPRRSAPRRRGSTSARSTTSTLDRGVGALVDGDAGRRLPLLALGRAVRRRQHRPVQRRLGAVAGHRRLDRRPARRGVADLQAPLRPPHRRVARRPRGRGRDLPDPVRCGGRVQVAAPRALTAMTSRRRSRSRAVLIPAQRPGNAPETPARRR